MGKATWRETQNTQGPPLDALKQAFPTHYEVWSGGHVDAEQARKGREARGRTLRCWECHGAVPVCQGAHCGAARQAAPPSWLDAPLCCLPKPVPFLLNSSCVIPAYAFGSMTFHFSPWPLCVQFTEGLMDAWVEQTCDALPVPECTLGVSFFEASRAPCPALPRVFIVTRLFGLACIPA